METYPDGGYGNIRIAAGNQAHCDEMARVMHRPFVPDSPYEQYLPQNMNFEDFCCRCAFKGEPLHTYVSLYQMGLWLNMFLLPLSSDKENDERIAALVAVLTTDDFKAYLEENFGEDVLAAF